jgi:hypothetical protein
MSKILITIGLTPANLERLDVLVRRGRTVSDHVLSGIERNAMLDLAIEFGLRHLEDLMPEGEWADPVHDAGVPTVPAPSSGAAMSRARTIHIVNSPPVESIFRRHNSNRG